MNEIKNQFSSLKKATEERLTKIEDSLTQIRKFNQEIDSTTSFIDKKYDDMKLKSECLEKECKENLALIMSLDEKIEEIQRILKIT